MEIKDLIKYWYLVEILFGVYSFLGLKVFNVIYRVDLLGDYG